MVNFYPKFCIRNRPEPRASQTSAHSLNATAVTIGKEMSDDEALGIVGLKSVMTIPLQANHVPHVRRSGHCTVTVCTEFVPL